ncbi:hypothetical protein GGR53DRAFT_486481 [Hypoxylon sp. FL1150]|nr:hypothetical protein GGR53DRAFT_486481 [Hypoxylon sp. FL1150]
MDGRKTWWQNLGLDVVVFLCGFGLVLARLFIAVKAIVSIRELPASAYQIPKRIRQYVDMVLRRGQGE